MATGQQVTVGFTSVNDAIDHILETIPEACPISFGRYQITHLAFPNGVTMSIAMGGANYCSHNGKNAEIAMWTIDGDIPFVPDEPQRAYYGWVKPDQIIEYAKFARDYAAVQS